MYLIKAMGQVTFVKKEELTTKNEIGNSNKNRQFIDFQLT